MTTPPESLDAGRDQAHAVLRGIWNTRVTPRPTEQHELSAIVRKELTSSDLGTVLALIARNEDDWEARGLLFAAMAEKLLQPEPFLQEIVPAEALLKDASRYRKLMRRAKVVQIDGRPWVHIEPIDALPATVRRHAHPGRISGARAGYHAGRRRSRGVAAGEAAEALTLSVPWQDRCIASPKSNHAQAPVPCRGHRRNLLR